MILVVNIKINLLEGFIKLFDNHNSSAWFDSNLLMLSKSLKLVLNFFSSYFLNHFTFCFGIYSFVKG